jgi:hypothetical protein
MEYFMNIMKLFSAFTLTLSVLPQFASAKPLVQIEKSEPVWGQIQSVYTRSSEEITGCGYFFTKGHAYQTWGPSVTFFVQQANGHIEELYSMHNGRKAFEPIQTLHVSTAKDYKIDTRNAIYKALYQTKIGGVFGSILPNTILRLSLERPYDENRFESARDTQIERISFKKKNLAVDRLGYQDEIAITCDF